MEAHKKTPDDVKKEFKRAGKTFSSWAKEHGFHYVTVLQVVNGQLKGNYGKAHEIAVKLGLKEAA